MNLPTTADVLMREPAEVELPGNYKLPGPGVAMLVVSSEWPGEAGTLVTTEVSVVNWRSRSAVRLATYHLN